VRTLHPTVHSGLLADLRLEAHERELAKQGIAPFELLVSNLYPFAQTVAAGAEPDAVVEQIDIGGPAMVRAAAKNHANVAVVTDPSQYAVIVDALLHGGTTLLERRELAVAAFRHTASYDIAVASWIGNVLAPDDEGSGFPGWVAASWERSSILRYGENSHQRAALYVSPGAAGIAQATQLGGKEMSYNNYVDADAALRAAYDHAGPTIAIIKHANPCGIATADTLAAAHAAAHACDPVSAFGGVIASNRVIDLATAESIAPIFTEAIVAPGYEADALARLQRKKDLRILQLPAGYGRGTAQSGQAGELKQISGGLLIQTADAQFAPAMQWRLATGDPVDAATLADLEFAWRAVRAVKSNAILLAKDGASVGIGMGQVNRVDSCRLAVERAGDRVAGSVAASDAYFPFDDGPRVLFEAGVRAIVQPGGSIRDADTIAAAQEFGVTMYFTGERHFFH
jgi:phosphoribosylaminoimidazolecarboxamide formyltransferase/IMP cyclohydrolase